MFSLESSLSEAYYKAMSQGQFIEYIEIMKPDFVIVDGFPYVDERVAIPYKLKIPFAVLKPIFDPTLFRMPVNPVAEAYNNRHIRTQGNFFEKAMAVMNILSHRVFYLFYERGYVKQLFPADPNVPKAIELISQAEVYLIESDPLNDYPRQQCQM